MEIIFTEVEKIDSKAGLEKSELVLGKLSMWCLWKIQVEIVNRQLEYMSWNIWLYVSQAQKRRLDQSYKF